MRTILPLIAAVAVIAVASSAQSQWQGSNPGPIYYSGGNVGIGTSSPQQTLDIFGNIGLGSGHSIFLHTSTDSNWTFGKDDSHNINVRGSGFQTRSFRVIDSNAETTRFAVNLATGDATVSGNLALTSGNRILLNSGTDPNWTFGKDANHNINIRGAGSGTRAFQVLDNSTGTDVVRFSVNLLTGNVTASGSVAANYSDVAEWVPARGELHPGTVVVVDANVDNGVLPSSRAYDTRVAGVISAQPGLILGTAGKTKQMVATTGRVKVRVDASRAAIHRGDLLVTSDEPGMAMKSEPVTISGASMHRPGTVIGKALEPMERGQGEILVLLSLQ